MPVMPRHKAGHDHNITIHIYLNREINAELKARSRALGHTAASVMRILIDDWLKEQRELESKEGSEAQG